MAITLDLKWDASQLVTGDEVSKSTLKSLRNAGDRAARKVVTDAVKYVQSRKRLKSTFIRKGIRISDRPGASASLDNLVWGLVISGKAIPLSQYGVTAFAASRKGEGGTKIRINPGKVTKLKGAFVQTLKSGHVGVFVRKGKEKFPIKQLMSMPLSEVIGHDPSAVDNLLAPARESMTAAFQQAMAELGAK